MRQLLSLFSFVLCCLMLLWVSSCTQESQNRLGRTVQNWTGTNGVLEVYARGKLVQRFLKIDKLSTVTDTVEPFGGSVRYGYGYLDENLNFHVDPGERKRYFEISARTTSMTAVFFENYKE